MHRACGEGDKLSCTFVDYEGLEGDGRLKSKMILREVSFVNWKWIKLVGRDIVPSGRFWY
jgi:hypothetical protein